MTESPVPWRERWEELGLALGRLLQEFDGLRHRLAFLHLVANLDALAFAEVALQRQTVGDADHRPIIELDHLPVHVDDPALDLAFPLIDGGLGRSVTCGKRRPKHEQKRGQGSPPTHQAPAWCAPARGSDSSRHDSSLLQGDEANDMPRHRRSSSVSFPAGMAVAASGRSSRPLITQTRT